RIVSGGHRSAAKVPRFRTPALPQLQASSPVQRRTAAARPSRCKALLLPLLAWAPSRAPPPDGLAPSPSQAPIRYLPLPPRSYRDVRIEGIPHVRQNPDFCGEACVEMALAKLGYRLTQDQVFDLSGVDPSLGRGMVTAELKTALERVGFDPGPV